MSFTRYWGVLLYLNNEAYSVLLIDDAGFLDDGNIQWVLKWYFKKLNCVEIWKI